MAPVKNGRIIFNSIPTGYPEPGKTTVYDTSQTISLNAAPLNDGFCSKLSGYLYTGSFATQASYILKSAFTVGEPLYSHGVGCVSRSDNPIVNVYGILRGLSMCHQIQTSLVYICGSSRNVWENCIPRLEVVFRREIGWSNRIRFVINGDRDTQGGTVFVTAGAGSVGSFVIQLAKRDGLRTIGSAGSPEKIVFLKEIGTDVTFNYKERQTRDALDKEGPLDINVGGEMLESSLDNVNMYGRFSTLLSCTGISPYMGKICGGISSYNEPEKPIRGHMNIFSKSLMLQGFVVFPSRGLDKVGDVILTVQRGTKAAVLVSEE
ncbi:hypothetical protein AX15_005852 [Amanita polypyramis BW_CC]|nr:hypothetical protein AX15_005852 [Amanita polypyramis BW_CC]